MEHCPRISQSFTQIVIRVKIVFFSGSPIWGPVYKSAFENSKYAPLKISICPLKACLFSQKQNLWRGWGMKSGVIEVMGTPIRKHCERYFTNTTQHGVDVSLWVVLWHSDRWVGGKVAVALNTKRWHLFGNSKYDIIIRDGFQCCVYTLCIMKSLYKRSDGGFRYNTLPYVLWRLPQQAVGNQVSGRKMKCFAVPAPYNTYLTYNQAQLCISNIYGGNNFNRVQ